MGIKHAHSIQCLQICRVLSNALRTISNTFVTQIILQLVQMPHDCIHFCTNGVGNMLIYNTKYKFIFNHESPHKDHYINERWEKGINHFVMNNNEEFINRYSRRINNMRELLSSGKHITFILTRPETGLADVPELVHVIKKNYPLLEFDFKFLDQDKHFYHEFLLLMKIDENSREVTRLGNHVHCS